MAELVQFPLKGGGFLVVEAGPAENSANKVMRGSPAAATIATASDTFESALEKVRDAAESLLHELRQLAQPPDEVAVEFGVKMNAEAGAIIARASAEANFKINLTWKKNAADGK